MTASNQTCNESDIRETLRYVPLLKKQSLCFLFDGGELSDPAVAQILLDLQALQNIDVRMSVVYFGKDKDEFLDRAAELELKITETILTQATKVMDRGQIPLVISDETLSFSESSFQFIEQLDAQKVLYLSHQNSFQHPVQGAVSLSHVADENRQSIERLFKSGVDRLHFVDGEIPGAISRELFSNEGVGDMVYQDAYREIRPLREEDIPELLALISRSIRAEHLVPRNYEEIREQLEDFHVLSIDNNFIGCVALHRYAEQQICEIACLFVKPTHKGLGYGQALVELAEQKASEYNYKKIFALSASADGFFEKNMGYRPIALSKLPAIRVDKLKSSNRMSFALFKDLSLLSPA